MQPVVPQLIDRVPSQCSVCGDVITSEVLERGGKVYQAQNCPRHAVPESLIFSDASLYRKLGWWNDVIFPPTQDSSRSGIADEKSQAGAGSFNEPLLAIIDITNRCNFKCPMCFAEASGEGQHYFLDTETVRGMLRSLLDRPVPCRHVQFSGGEPTLHPEFPRILRIARDLGFTHIQVATNGSRFVDRGYARQCEDSGLHTLYLQFDGLSDDVYRILRGRPLLKSKIAAVDNIVGTNMRLVLVPTIASSINTDQLGPIFQFALDRSPHITGISIQPAAHVGRTEVANGHSESFNLAMMARQFGEQTGLTRLPDDWFPLSAVSLIGRALGRLRGEPTAVPDCDAHCSLGTYFYIDDNNKPYCLTRFLDLDKLFQALSAVPAGKEAGFISRCISQIGAFERLSAFFHKEKAPDGLTFQRLLRGLEGWEDKQVGRSAGWSRRGFNGMFVAGMHFMDARSYNLRRLHRCIIQYVTTDHQMIPFCSYNAGPRVRNSEEKWRMDDAEAACPAPHGAGC